MTDKQILSLLFRKFSSDRLKLIILNNYNQFISDFAFIEYSKKNANLILETELINNVSDNVLFSELKKRSSSTKLTTSIEFEQFLNYVDKITSKDENAGIAPDVAILEYVNANRNKLSENQIYRAAFVLYEIGNPTIILEFAIKYVSEKNFLNMMGTKIYKSDNFSCMNKFIEKFPGMSINSCMIQKMCDCCEFAYLCNYLDSVFISVETKKNIVNAFIESASLEQLVVLLESYSVFITPEQRDMIKGKVDVLVQMETTNVSAAEYARSFFVEEKKPQDDIKPAKQKIPANNQ